MNYLTDQVGKQIEARNPLYIKDASVSTDVTSIASETVTFKTGAAGFRGIVTLDKGPIMNLTGSKVGSFWKDRQNLMVSNRPTAFITALTETDGSAAITITDQDNQLEQLFEVTSGNSEYILVVTDPSGDQLYGFIRGIATTGNSYVITINSTVAGGTANWIGSQSNFDSSDVAKVGFEIYSYEGSLAWTTGTILTQEVQYSPGNSDIDNLKLLTTNGDYSVDYARGRIFYKKATTGTSDIVSYVSRVLTTIGSSATATNSSGAISGQNNSFTSISVKATPGKLLWLCATNTTAFLKYIQVHNKASAATAGETAARKYPVPANDTIILGARDLGFDGHFLSTGISLAASTVLTTFTAATAGDLVLDYEFI